MEEDTERRVQEIGRELLSRADSINRRGVLVSRRYWEEKALDVIMRREALKVQLLRYIDVYPALKSCNQRISHLLQYLNNSSVLRDRMARFLYYILKFHPVPLNTIYGLATSTGVSLFAHKFIAGKSPQQAMDYIKHLSRKNMTCTLDILGEAVLSENEADEYTRRYVELMEDVGKLIKQSGLSLQLNVSVKPSSFYSQFKPSAPERTAENVCRRLSVILKKAKDLNAFVNLDMEQYTYRDVTLLIFEKLSLEPEFKEYPNLGMVVQAYLKDTQAFANKVIELARRRQCPFTVRLVKGAYWDYEIINARQREWEIPVYLQKWQTDASFEQTARLLIDVYPALKLAIGSHSVRSISYAMAYAQQKGIPKTEIEFQLLYGMGDDIKEAIADMGYPVRVYAPYGELIPGMAYLVRRILENTSNESFLRQRSARKTPPDELLRNPLEQARNENERNQFITVSE